jgi:hypothetical protein
MNTSWSGQDEAEAILFDEFTALMPALEENGIGITIPDAIRRFAEEGDVVSRNSFLRKFDMLRNRLGNQ